MTYEAWRCTFQSAEAAARAAYAQVHSLVAENAGLREKWEARCPGLVQIQEPAPQSKVLAAILAARGALQHLKEGGKHSESLFKEALQAIDSVVAPIESTQAASAPVVLPEPTYQISQPFPSDPANTWRDASSKAYDLSLPSKCRIVYTEQQVRALLAATCSLVQEVYDEFIKNGHDGGEFEDGEHPLADRVRAFLAGTLAPYESILIEGAVYSVPTPVAGELLRLHLEILQAAPAPMVNMTPPATHRDRWMYQQGRLAERDARTHAVSGPCGQCKSDQQPCYCAIDTLLSERGSVAVNKEHYEKVSKAAKAAQGVPASAAHVNAEAIAAAVCQRVSELPDRDSPDDWPEAMLVTHEELRTIVAESFADNEAQAEDARDAARYRRIRVMLFAGDIVIDEATLILRVTGVCPTFDEFDAGIDAAVRAAQPTKGG